MSKRTKPDPDLARWCAVLAEGAAIIDAVPAGWFTCAQLAANTGKAAPTMKHALKRLVEAGKVEVKNFRVRLKKMVRPVPHYRLK
jgi:DNA-binding transcriptional ArsR family regulator